VDTNTERTIARKESRAIATNISLLFSTSFSPFFFFFFDTLRCGPTLSPSFLYGQFFYTVLEKASFETRPGSAGRFGIRSTRDCNRARLTKKRKEKTRYDLASWPGDSADRSRPGDKPVDFCFFCFFTKTTSFWIFLKNWLGRPGQTRWPGQNPEPEPWTGRVLKLCWKVKRVQIPNWWFRLL